MEPLKLEGETLGQKHKHYNKLVKEFISTKTVQQIKKIDYNEPDIENLFKIDIASNAKDVDYILEVLKCEDMLYVSRALKQSEWLITDPKYADIISPDFLHSQLLPQMTSKAGNKLILFIRLKLKDEKRVELFFKYYEDKKKLNTAVKWLPNCSISFIENMVEIYTSDIFPELAKRLCEKSATVLEIYSRKNNVYLRTLLSKTTFLFNKHPEDLLKIIKSQHYYNIPNLNPKCTKIIMKVRPDIILENFEKFATKISIPTFVKFLKREEIKDFLRKQLKNKKLQRWFTFENMKPFFSRIPNEGRFDFIKSTFIEKSGDESEVIQYDNDEDEAMHDAFDHSFEMLCSVAKRVRQSNLSNQNNLYKWYKFAPFSTAFKDLMKLIRMESNPNERNEIFSVLITCAKGNLQNLQTVLRYYRTNHINESLKFKSHFVNMVLSQSISLKFDDATWNILNDIFYSMEVYSESENNVQICLKYIIAYKIIHNTKVPEIIEKKFNFESLKTFQSKLNEQEREKVFQYLYQMKIKQIQDHAINSVSDLTQIIQDIKSVLNLLRDWKKNLLNYSIILEKIREITKINEKKSWNVNLSDIYNTNKSWRIHMFRESLCLYPSQETCINALKHDPEILESRKEIFLNDSLILTQLLNKLRVYWPQTLAKAFEETFRNQLNAKAKHKSSVRGLCVLLPKQQLNKILSQYIPHDSTIVWGVTDDCKLSIQKCFAKYMFLARPPPPVDIILLYAKGDYLQFVLHSVHSILFNLSSTEIIKYIPTLLDAPVSLQKHGLKIAFAKLNIDELLPTSLNTWKSTKNSSIRATIFKLIFDLLCKEKNENNVQKIWNILDSFIDNLTVDENRIIYTTLGEAKKVPHSVKQAFCIKSYSYFKTLPPKANCDIFLKSVIASTTDIMESIDLDFIVEIIFETSNEKLMHDYLFTNIISSCLLYTKSETIQTQRYERIFVPLLKKYSALIQKGEKSVNFYYILMKILADFDSITLKKNMITPIKLFNDMHKDLEEYFSGEDYYVMIISCSLTAKYMQILDKYRVHNLKGDEIYARSAPEFGKLCMELLSEEIKKHFPSIYKLFAKAVRLIFNQFRFSNLSQLATLKAIQENCTINEEHLLVLNLLPTYVNNIEKEEKQKLCDVLSSHPSAEVRMHYQQMLRTVEGFM